MIDNHKIQKLAAQFQKFAERDVKEINVDFTEVSEMDNGAAQGISEGVELAKRLNPSISIHLKNIGNVEYAQLEHCGITVDSVNETFIESKEDAIFAKVEKVGLKEETNL